MQKTCKGGTLPILAARDAVRLQALASQLDGSSRHRVIPVDMSDDASTEGFGRELETMEAILDGIVMMSPPLPRSFNVSLIRDMAEVLPNELYSLTCTPESCHRQDASRQVLGQFAASNTLRPAWLGQAKTFAFALGERGIHVNTVSLGGILTDEYKGLIPATGALKTLVRPLNSVLRMKPPTCLCGSTVVPRKLKPLSKDFYRSFQII